MKGRLAPALVAALVTATGCFSPTWRALPPGGVPARDAVVLVGRISLVPPLGFTAAPAPGVVTSPADAAQAVALFTADLAEPFEGGGARMPLERAWSAWVPLDTWFFVEVPRPGPLHLRGVVVPGVSSTMVEAAARLPIAAGDRVVYVGDVTIVRERPARVSCRTRLEDARRAAAELGHSELLASPWASRIAVPEAPSGAAPLSEARLANPARRPSGRPLPRKPRISGRFADRRGRGRSRAAGPPPGNGGPPAAVPTATAFD